MQTVYLKVHLVEVSLSTGPLAVRQVTLTPHQAPWHLRM